MPSLRAEVKIAPDFLSHLDVGQIMSGVAVSGEAAAYALVWEYGNLRQTKKGPKTTLGINPCGENVWLTLQAPLGYVGMNLSRYLDAADTIFGEADFDAADSAPAMRALMLERMSTLADVAAAIAAETAPVDSGNLASEIIGISPGDSALGEVFDPNNDDQTCGEWMRIAGRV